MRSLTTHALIAACAFVGGILWFLALADQIAGDVW